MIYAHELKLEALSVLMSPTLKHMEKNRRELMNDSRIAKKAKR